jgi:hypothetical protein
VQDPYLKSLFEAIDKLDDVDFEGPHLITVDELRAAGALDVPAGWRKSLGTERDLFADGSSEVSHTDGEASSGDSDRPPAPEA